MTTGITRERALELLHENVKKESMIAHSLASEAVLRAIAKKLGEDVELWGMAGLLHDIDVEITNGDSSIHGLKAVELLRAEGIPEEITEAISLHNEEAAPAPRSTRLHYALAAGETITGLVTATTYVYPERKLAVVKPKSVVKRMKEKAFAASVNRETILECEKIGIPIEEFAVLAVEAMREIHDDLGL